MDSAETPTPIKKTLPTGKRKAINVSGEGLVKISFMDSSKRLPLNVQPTLSDVKLAEWTAHNREFIDENLLKYGAILFRDFKVESAARFEEFVKTVSGELLEYVERSSPRTRVSGNIYTSTDYPSSHSIFPHNENAYALAWPLKIYFYCDRPAEQGGETPIADVRRVLRRIRPETRERFIGRKWMYVRNFGQGLGLEWQTVFQTSDKQVVEQYCRNAGIDCEWREGDRLRTRQVRPAVMTHPRTGEMLWFNHAAFFHVSTLELPLRESLLAEFRPEDLPNNTYYGDGSPIEPRVLDEIREAYMQEMVTFQWMKGDVLMLDNMLTAHARQPYVGSRTVLVAMAEPFASEET